VPGAAPAGGGLRLDLGLHLDEAVDLAGDNGVPLFVQHGVQAAVFGQFAAQGPRQFVPAPHGKVANAHWASSAGLRAC
jgi:hypothetical protein